MQFAGFMDDKHSELAQLLNPGCSASYTRLLWLFFQIVEKGVVERFLLSVLGSQWEKSVISTSAVSEQGLQLQQNFGKAVHQTREFPHIISFKPPSARITGTG